MAIVAIILGGYAGFLAFAISLFFFDYTVVAAIGMYFVFAITVMAVTGIVAIWYERPHIAKNKQARMRRRKIS